jgi:hypothetical protein
MALKNDTPLMRRWVAMSNARKTPAEARADLRRELQRDLDALKDIHQLLDGKEWGSDTLEQIAEVIRETGREIREPDYNGNEQ